MTSTVTIAVKIIQTTPVAVAVLPGEDPEAAVWLRLREVVIGDQRLDGKTRIDLPAALADRRGLRSAIEV